ILVTEVFPGDPAAKAGIRPEDIIIEINAKPITTSRELTRVIADAGVGDTVRIKVLRNSTEKTFDVKVAKREDSKLTLKSLKQSQENELGIRVSEITPEIANRFNISESEGIIIIGIEPGSKGQEAGAQPGDIIREVNHTFIKTVDQYTEIIENIPEGNPVNMFIRRMNIGFLVIKMTK
ncbi:MAG: PDZ domain-containing protein, partial [Desulfobacterales bacterium]|nr:PDZ domain-containing protein [Desulfobacterales bacterium]